MINDLLISIASSFDYHLRVELDNPCLFDDSSVDCFIFEQFFKTSPPENFFVENYQLIKENSSMIEFNSKWYFDPFKMSYDLYQTKHFAPLILLVNDIPSILDFHPDYLNKSTLLYPDKGFIEKLVWDYLDK